jgi:hypothetical protein
MAQITLNSTGVASNGSLVLQSNGTTTAVTVDTAQNVGVGTGSTINVSGMEISRATGVSPTPVELRLTTTTNDSGWSTSNPWGRISFYSADASVSGAKVHASIQTTAQSSTGGNSNLDFFVTDTANGNLYRTLSFQGAGTNTTQTVFYSGGGTEAARIDSSGNVGIGTSSPSYKLDVAGFSRGAIVHRAASYTNGGTTLSVSGVTVLFISNSSATTITNFTDGANEQVIYLYFNDSNTTINRSNAYLAGGANFVSTRDDMLVLIKNGANWYEISRSANS